MRMTLGFLLISILTGCHNTQRVVPPPGCDPVYSQYHLDQFRWAGVGRVLVLPFANESQITKADEDIARALRAELQQMGRFEVVAAEPDEIARLSEQIHRNGRFNEAAMIHLGKCYNADVVIHGTITQYSPYPRPRIGVTLQAVSPAEGKVVASVDGLWDSNHLPIAKRAQGYYIQRKHDRTAYHEANWIYPDDGHADELALLSPQLYQRWVCSELAAILVQDPAATGQLFSPRGTKAQTPTRPPEALNVVPAGGSGPPFPVPPVELLTVEPKPGEAKPIEKKPTDKMPVEPRIIPPRQPDLAQKPKPSYNAKP